MRRSVLNSRADVRPRYFSHPFMGIYESLVSHRAEGDVLSEYGRGKNNTVVQLFTYQHHQLGYCTGQISHDYRSKPNARK